MVVPSSHSWQLKTVQLEAWAAEEAIKSDRSKSEITSTSLMAEDSEELFILM